MLDQLRSVDGLANDLLPRAERTLELMHRWGYAPTVQALAAELMGGSVPPEELRSAILHTPKITLAGPFVCLGGLEHLLAKSQAREMMNRSANGHARAIAEEFAQDLIRWCPLVDCIALSGSAASGGFMPRDDVDFDLFVRNGAKYLTYALALLLGLRYSILRHGGGPLRKVICINVIWTSDQASPFARRDADLAFELLRCRPLIGEKYFRGILRANDWIARYFPQVERGSKSELPRPRPNLLGRLLVWIAGHPMLLASAERLGRALSFAVYRGVHWFRRNDRDAMERLVFLQRVKYPYEVFQD